MIDLPEAYLKKMKLLLKDEYEAYLHSFQQPRTYGLRVNTSKIAPADLVRIAPFDLEPIPWSQSGFYYQEQDRPAKDPYYYAGLYYIQEPSAMLPGEVLPLKPGDLILDGCAAPGGKSAALADRMGNGSIIISNDISISRAQVLLKTIETQGIITAAVMAEDLSRLDRFNETFDKILLDAPCSGEGMFRKEPELIRSWQQKGSDFYAPLQKQLITAAVKMLKPGGMLVYSTCTFALEEDEEVIEYALDSFTDLKVLPITHHEGFVSGLTGRTKNCVRLYPHRIKGEGHFAALLQKGEILSEAKQINGTAAVLPAELQKLITKEFPDSTFIRRNDKLYVEPDNLPELDSLRILRSGLYLGEYRHERFVPAQALAMALKPDEFVNTIHLSRDDERVIRYLKCETLNVKDLSSEGYVLVCVEDYPLGFGKVSAGILKNLYPANYRYQ